MEVASVNAASMFLEGIASPLLVVPLVCITALYGGFYAYKRAFPERARADSTKRVRTRQEEFKLATSLFDTQGEPSCQQPELYVVHSSLPIVLLYFAFILSIWHANVVHFDCLYHNDLDFHLAGNIVAPWQPQPASFLEHHTKEQREGSALSDKQEAITAPKERVPEGYDGWFNLCLVLLLMYIVTNALHNRLSTGYWMIDKGAFADEVCIALVRLLPRNQSIVT
jgi:hypothetical protein